MTDEFGDRLDALCERVKDQDAAVEAMKLVLQYKMWKEGREDRERERVEFQELIERIARSFLAPISQAIAEAMRERLTKSLPAEPAEAGNSGGTIPP